MDKNLTVSVYYRFINNIFWVLIFIKKKCILFRITIS